MYYLYQHTTSNNIPFYIGKGTKSIVKGANEYERAFSKQNRNKKWKLLAEKGYNVNILLESEDLEFVLKEENKIWSNCSTCVNSQLNNKFKDYELFKVTTEITTLRIFNRVYIIFSNGDIYNIFGKKLIGFDNGKGYKSVAFSDREKYKKNFYIHRLIAEAFIPNSHQYSVVNHIDLNRSNNHFSNLEWCTQKENINHSVKALSYSSYLTIKKVYQFSKKGEFIKEWDSVAKAAVNLNCTDVLIHMSCNQNNINCFSAVGYLWAYKDEYENDKTPKLKKRINTLFKKEEIKKNVLEEITLKKLSRTEISKKYNISYGTVKLWVKNNKK